MLERGVFLPPSGYETMFVSLAHTDADLDAIVDAASEAADRELELAHSRFIVRNGSR